MANHEYQAISKVTADLNTALSSNNCVEWFADKLADAAIISHSVRQGLDALGYTRYQKAAQVTNALMPRVRSQPKHFYTILDIMSEESALLDIRTKLLRQPGSKPLGAVGRHRPNVLIPCVLVCSPVPRPSPSLASPNL